MCLKPWGGICVLVPVTNSCTFLWLWVVKIFTICLRYPSTTRNTLNQSWVIALPRNGDHTMRSPQSYIPGALNNVSRACQIYEKETTFINCLITLFTVNSKLHVLRFIVQTATHDLFVEQSKVKFLLDGRALWVVAI